MLSEKNFILGMLRFTAVMIPDRRASASATIGDETLSMMLLPCVELDRDSLVMIHARPAFFVDLFQAASVLQMLVVHMLMRGEFLQSSFSPRIPGTAGVFFS